MVRLNRAKEFLDDGFKVKLTVKFKGREMVHQELGHRVLQEALTALEGKAAVERDPKFEGRKLSMIITKVKGGKKDEQNENTQINTEKV